MDIEICLDGGLVLKNNGNYKCLAEFRSYESVDLVATGTHYTPDPTIYAMTFGASFTMVAIFYATGMGIRSVLKMIK